MSSLFLVICKDKPGAVALRKETRPRHLLHMETLGDRLKLAGPFLNADGDPCGSLLIVEGESVEAVEAFVRQDPYNKAGLFANVEVRPWLLVAGDWHPSGQTQI